MKTFEFTLIASGIDPEASGFEDRFFEAGCDDATLSLQKGVIIMEFSREAVSFSQAVASACEDALRAGATVERVEPDHLIREVALFADRSDVAEEVSRLTAHLQQFAELVRAGGEGAGRRLEFVTQEMGREVNTLGSKAGDAAVSREVVEMKAALEKVRELIQNVE